MLPEPFVVPLRAGVLLYWVLAATAWVMSRVYRAQRARDLYVRDLMYTSYIAESGGDLAGFYDIHGHDIGGADLGGADFDFDFDVDGD